MENIRTEKQLASAKFTICLLSLLTACAIFVAFERNFQLRQVRESIARVSQERSSLSERIAELQRELDSPSGKIASLSAISTNQWGLIGEDVDCPSNAIAPTGEMEPVVRLIERGGRQIKTFVFRKLYSPLGRVLAEDVEFRDVVGLSIRFWDAKGTLYFGADQVHPVVLTSVGLKADLGLQAETARFQSEASQFKPSAHTSPAKTYESDYERRIKSQIRQQQLEIERLEAARRLEYLRTNRSGSDFYFPLIP